MHFHNNFIFTRKLIWLLHQNATEINDTVDAEDRRPDDGEYPSSSRQSPSSSFIKEEPFQNNGSLDNDDETVSFQKMNTSLY